MVQRQRGHPAEPCPTARFQPGVELRYLSPASAAVVAQGSVPTRVGCCGWEMQQVPAMFCPSWGEVQHVHQGVAVLKICVCPGREDVGVPQHVGLCLGLQGQLPSETHSGAVLDSRQGPSACQATPMACTDIQIHAGLSFRYFLQLLAFCKTF